MKQRILPALFLALLIAAQSCRKDRDLTDPVTENTAIWVLNEGQMTKNNSDITIFDTDTKQTTEISVGETGSDLQQYGSKIYCVVSGIKGTMQSFVRVFNPVTKMLIKDISFNGNVEGFMPRKITFDQGKAYVSCLDGTLRRIDTASLSIDAELKDLGAMEGLAIANGKLYVANSDHFQYPNATLKNTISVVNLQSFTKNKDIAITTNPTALAAQNDKVYVASAGNYADIAGDFNMIDTNTDQIRERVEANIAGIALSNTSAYVISGTYGQYKLRPFDLNNIQLGPDFAGAINIQTLYGLSVDGVTGELLITDAADYASNGTAHIIRADGSLKTSFSVGVNPQKAVFVYTSIYK